MKDRIKKCAKCGTKKPLEQFGTHIDSSDGHQSYCKQCKNALGKRRREINVKAYLKHHTATRVGTQLGKLAPEGFAKDLETLLGYRITTLVKHLREDLRKREPGRKLRDALQEGYHIDHIYPLSRFIVIQDGKVNWEEFKRCWHYTNLSAIPAAENLAKGAKVE